MAGSSRAPRSIAEPMTLATTWRKADSSPDHARGLRLNTATMPAGPSRPSTDTPIALRMPEPSSCGEAVDVARREVLDHERPVGGEDQPGQRALAHRPALALGAARRIADHREAVELHAVDLVDRAGVGVEPLGDDLGQPLRELADVGGDERDPPSSAAASL